MKLSIKCECGNILINSKDTLGYNNSNIFRFLVEVGKFGDIRIKCLKCGRSHMILEG